eukprot:scaffold1055_cov165-Amphora_coffeaeformis.AAC.12
MAGIAIHARTPTAESTRPEIEQTLEMSTQPQSMDKDMEAYLLSPALPPGSSSLNEIRCRHTTSTAVYNYYCCV